VDQDDVHALHDPYDAIRKPIYKEKRHGQRTEIPTPGSGLSRRDFLLKGASKTKRMEAEVSHTADHGLVE
jgi:hypothetical protein